jgi:RNA polymerase sigma-54 factor
MQRLEHTQKQVHTLAPQMVQSLKVLQAPAAELQELVLQELQTNPALEDMTHEGSDLTSEEDPDVDRDELIDSHKELLDYLEGGTFANAQREHRDREAEERRQHFWDSIPSEITLTEHLMRQARTGEFTPDELEIFEYVVGNLDDKGFLPMPFEDIASTKNASVAAVERVVRALQSMDPPGLGCKDVRESLLCQLEVWGKEDALEARILREHYDLLLKRKFPALAKTYGVTTDAIQAAINAIGTLDFAPGRRFTHEHEQGIIPDVTVIKENGVWNITLNKESIPRLGISSLYKRLLGNAQLTPTERAYIKGKIHSGRLFIHAIDQRQHLLQRMTEKLLEFQHAFFESGISHLKPLKMQKMADALNFHETTISRAISNKYLATPYGILAFRSLFTGGIPNNDGNVISSTSIKESLRQLIASEPPSSPLSDQQLSRLLSKHNTPIARRTVSKYREELGIPSAALRKKY